MKLQTLNYLQRRLDGKVSKRRFNGYEKTLFRDAIWLYVLEYDPTLANSGKKNSLNMTEEIGVLSHPDAANPLITLRPTRF